MAILKVKHENKSKFRVEEFFIDPLIIHLTLLNGTSVE